MAKIFDSAMQFLNMGISIFPLYHRSKMPALHSWEPYKTALPSEQDLHIWFATNWLNYGVVAGWCNLAFLDFDDMQAFSLWLDWFLLLNKHTEIYPMPFIVSTARGAHVYISAPCGGSNHRRRGCDVKYHGYCVGPGSVHPSGTEYVAITEFKLVEVYSLDTILPLDLFPLVAPSPLSDVQPLPFAPIDTEYDPFAAASNGATDLITKVKQSVRIENLFSGAIRTSADGRWLSALCPFHDDSHPSFWIDTRMQLCGCNVCGMKPMDSINLYARMHNVSESVAVGALAQEIGVWR